ncbi:hypothetical protein DEJ01_09860 [Curtobacterium sp. MCLR17_040]|uniref:SAM-dependent methyltransferase n=1 Tax=Curtobacterium sp. MCLR17_040 TaxID=2175625 RepID=UPI000DA95131|nr:SAM-dependent methyltransferase [Curtobacterium sp. MCLR17_040]PZF02822.1 hypothetical protein DEJ01_09860 [Curtobacterium sp. MCLR17_040]
MHSGDDTLRPLRDDLRVPDAEADLYLVGLGIGGFDQRTVEVDRLLRGAAAIYHLTAFHEELQALSLGNVEDLSSLYFSGRNAASTYEDMTAYLREQTRTVREYGYVCFLTYGHPLYLVDTSWSLLQDDGGFRVKAIAATSFIDRLLCDLDYRFDYGVQIYEANVFLAQMPAVEPSTPLILSQVGEVGSDEIAERGRKLEWLTPLFEQVGNRFPPDRQCDLIFSPYRSDMAPNVVTARVDELMTLASSVHTGSTLLVHGA